MDDPRNVIILGSGCAGLTAAIYTGRAGLKPLVIEGLEFGGQRLGGHRRAPVLVDLDLLHRDELARVEVEREEDHVRELADLDGGGDSPRCRASTPRTTR